jgi:hypothetical protein
MATVRNQVLGIILLAGALVASADESGKAAAKANARGAGKGVTAKSSPIAPGPGRMQVEEPKADAAAPDAKASKTWQKTHAKGGLTEAQKQAFRDRKEKMEGMIAVIKAKRKALHDAKPEERAALARELHSLILERDSDPAGATAAARVETQKDAKPAASPADARKAEAEAQAKQREEYRKQQLEKFRQQLKASGEDG